MKWAAAKEEENGIYRGKGAEYDVERKKKGREWRGK